MKKCILPAIALMIAVPFSSAADKPRVSRDQIIGMEKALDQRLQGLATREDPVDLVGVTRGMYIDGYGAVFTGEINLGLTGGISPFHQKISKEEVAHVHQTKTARLVKLREAMQDMLMDAAASLDPVPDDEQIAVGVSLFCWRWEDTSGLPEQIVMHAPKRDLIAAKRVLDAKPGQTDRTALNAAVAVQEF